MHSSRFTPSSSRTRVRKRNSARACALLAVLFAGGCSGFSVGSLWPFGTDGLQGREPGPPANAVAYRCEGNRAFYLRMLENGAAWVILPEREFRLDRISGAPGRFGNGSATLEIKEDLTSLNDGAGQSYTACRVPKVEVGKG